MAQCLHLASRSFEEEKMLSGFFSGVSGLYYNQQKLDVSAHNISNVDTTGFKRSLAMFSTRKKDATFSKVDRDVQVRNPDFYGIERAGIFQDIQRSGELRQTNDAMDLAIDSDLKNAFFSVKRPGSAETLYTRNGRLSIGHENPNDFNSPSVLYVGGHIALDENGGAIPINIEGGALNITEDGHIYQGEEAVGEIPLFRFNKSSDPLIQENANLNVLKRLGDSLYQIPEEFQQEFHPSSLKVGEGGVRRLVVQGAKESSNVNVFGEMVEMMNTTKSADANRVAMLKHVEGLQNFFDLVRR